MRGIKISAHSPRLRAYISSHSQIMEILIIVHIGAVCEGITKSGIKCMLVSYCRFFTAMQPTLVVLYIPCGCGCGCICLVSQILKLDQRHGFCNQIKWHTLTHTPKQRKIVPNPAVLHKNNTKNALMLQQYQQQEQQRHWQQFHKMKLSIAIFLNNLVAHSFNCFLCSNGVMHHFAAIWMTHSKSELRDLCAWIMGLCIKSMDFIVFISVKAYTCII